ncbi:MAG: pilus assembly protein [Sandaracinaceae bacterium]|nr:pilus assembly protein [Sandaracinaceae bacterium]
MTSFVRQTRGAVYVEFLIVFIPVLTLFLGSIQAALLYGANLVVRHSATTAARAAIVVLDDEPENYDDQPRNSVTKPSGGSSSNSEGLLSTLTDLLGGGSGGSSGGSSGDSQSTSTLGGKRFSAIRSAASLPLLGISPSLQDLTGSQTLRSAIGTSNVSRLAGAFLYNKAAVAVTFPQSPNSGEYQTTFAYDEDVTVRVTYMFNCAVPIVNRWMCDSYLALKTGYPTEMLSQLADMISNGATLNEIQAFQAAYQQRRDRLQAQQPGMEEIEQGAESPNLGYLLMLTGSRFHVLRQEATLPNHAGRYEYTQSNNNGGGG